MSDAIVIVNALRTAMGCFNGAFSKTPATALGAAVIQALYQQAALPAESIDSVLMGCVLPAGTGQAPARQAALHAELPQSTHAVTINKVCGSGMQAAFFAHDALLAGRHDMVIAGGMENMTRAPYLLEKARQGYRLGHGTCLDHLFTDGLEDAFEHTLMGVYAEATAQQYGFTRQQQDDFAIASLERAQTAIDSGAFSAEIVEVNDTTTDENPGKAKPEKIPQLKPAFAKDGTVTAANASSISDGAAAMLLTRASTAQQHGLTPVAEIKATAVHAHDPKWFTTAPVGAIEKVLTQCGWGVDEVDLFEINEAFAVVTMAAMHDLKLDHNKVNVHGGACALGHPLGASGARIVTTLIHALQRHGKKRGVAALCIGGGEATAIAIELL